LDVTLTVEIMHDLGVMNNFHVSPIFNPILLPKKDKVDVDSATPPTVPTPAADQAKDTVAAPAANDATPAKEADATDPNIVKIEKTETAGALMEVASAVHKAVHGCRKLEAEGQKDACAAGYNKAYEIYELGLSYVRMNKVEFEEERRVLGSFREELKGLIALKKWRINYMEKQKVALIASIEAGAEAPIEAILRKIQEHKAIITKSCNDMATRSAEASKELLDIEKVSSELWSTGSSSATGAATGAAAAVETKAEETKEAKDQAPADNGEKTVVK